MQERKEREKPSAENILTGVVLLTAGGVAAAEIFFGLPHHEVVDLPVMIAIANVQGIPATPIFMAVKERVRRLQEAILH